VLPALRGASLGRTLAERAIAEAWARRYERVRLDTHRPSMAAAIALYRKLGFVQIPPYGPNPDGQFAFFEKRLSE
jgi:ribosomal protein S18 acetylase RimI-like enzyme